MLGVGSSLAQEAPPPPDLRPLIDGYNVSRPVVIFIDRDHVEMCPRCEVCPPIVEPMPPPECPIPPPCPPVPQCPEDLNGDGIIGTPDLLRFQELLNQNLGKTCAEAHP